MGKKTLKKRKKRRGRSVALQYRAYVGHRSYVPGREGLPPRFPPPKPVACCRSPFTTRLQYYGFFFTCPAITVGTVILRALDRVRERAHGCFARSPKSPHARRNVVSPTCHRVP